MKISFQLGVGGRRGYRVDGANRAGFDEVAKDVRHEIVRALGHRTMKATKETAVRLARTMNKIAARELQNLRRLVTDEMIGVRSNPGSPTEFTEQHLLHGLGSPFDNSAFGPTSKATLTGFDKIKAAPPRGRIVWKTLTARGKRRRTGRGTNGHNKDRFFRDTDALVNSLRSGLTDALFRKAGGVQVTVHRARNSADVPRGEFVSGKLAIARIEVRIFPHLTGHHLPYLTTGSWDAFRDNALLEKFLFGDGDEFIKLRGPMKPRVHRPLLQPVLSFFMAYRIPRVLALAIRSANLPGRTNDPFSGISSNRR